MSPWPISAQLHDPSASLTLLYPWAVGAAGALDPPGAVGGGNPDGPGGVNEPGINFGWTG